MSDYRMKWVGYVQLKKDGAYFVANDEDLATIPAKGAGIYIFCRSTANRFLPSMSDGVSVSVGESKNTSILCGS